jgi:hypothetical protein
LFCFKSADFKLPLKFQGFIEPASLFLHLLVSLRIKGYKSFQIKIANQNVNQNVNQNGAQQQNFEGEQQTLAGKFLNRGSRLM